MATPFQVLSTCPCCHVESAMVEILDPGIAEGLAIEATCRLCGQQMAMGEIRRPGRVFETPQAARQALQDWASAEGEPDLASFCLGSLCGITPAEACRRLVAGEAIETSFDVLAMLFPGSGGGMGAAESADAAFQATRSMLDGPAAPPELPRSSPRLVPRALAAVMLADGEVGAAERAYLDGWLAQHQHDPLTAADLQPWRPGDLGWLATPAPVIEAMVALAYADRRRDGTEWRVIREFARYWRYPLADLEALGRSMDARNASAGQRLWRALRAVFIRSN